ncbi:MAG: aminoacyl-tRNA hydrolase [Actinobacteria bacterium]|uniref:peptidyl-tRNA hydrolase n=1 Tax=freshwater metagenome TaxID=449393 RepID=A0A6J7RZK6_9ZZZZ|nr:aminoacyl-tRNA hydrolase [Actinomycetota bacterium]MSY26488.1 aminoacyl-tRNA hydrolase [Actinomycetota bacterium]MSZ86630.1 aminoacyl-tRNA hydrolase [Actinomycetota bacterium]MTB24391.1 aminoacyl-tRNA hydrolase [Actinomycetota bacterium]
MTERWLILGLGNPGPEYANTRHNIGYLVVEEIAKRISGSFVSHKSRADVLEGRLGVGIDAPSLILAKAKSYMNESGGPGKALADFYKTPLDHIIVIHDELDLPFEAIRSKLGGGDNGHNGLKSLSKSLGGPGYLRIRMGIGRPQGRQDPADFVLKPFSTEERKVLPLFVDRGSDAVESLLTRGLEETQQRFND